MITYIKQYILQYYKYYIEIDTEYSILEYDFADIPEKHRFRQTIFFPLPSFDFKRFGFRSGTTCTTASYGAIQRIGECFSGLDEQTSTFSVRL